MRRIRDIAFAVSSPVLLIFSFPNPLNKNGFFILAWIAFIPLFLALENKDYKQRFLIGYFAGVLFYAGVLYWLFPVSVPGSIVLILLLSLSFGLFGLFFLNAIRGTRYAVLYLPSLWVSLEFLRTHLFTGFPWALLGYSQHVNLQLIQIADVTGVYGVSFLIACVNCILYEIIVRRNKNALTYAAAGVLLLGAVLFYGKYNMERPIFEEDLKVAAVQGNIPQHLKWERSMEQYIVDKYDSLSREAAADGSDLIIWPETAVPGLLESEEWLFERVTGLAKLLDRTFLVGTIKEADSGMYNVATLVSKKGEILESYSKIHLVPFGEYVPFEERVPFFRHFIDKPIGDFLPGDDYTLFRFKVTKYLSGSEGGVKSIEKNTMFYSFGALICFEDIFPSLVRGFVKKGARFMAVITNDAWFGETSAAYQHNQASVFRAVENRVPFVRAANTGFSCIIDQKGKMIASVTARGRELFVDGFVAGPIKPFHWDSFYTKYGDLFAWACVFVFLSFFIWSSRRKKAA